MLAGVSEGWRGEGWALSPPASAVPATTAPVFCRKSRRVDIGIRGQGSGVRDQGDPVSKHRTIRWSSATNDGSLTQRSRFVS
jgi:hypothetical protein